MELEFDKEIDALLRKARSGTLSAVPKSGHLDADSIAAFAEGTVPEAVRKTYTAHLSYCDSCRKALSRVALWREPLAAKVVAAAAPAMRAAPNARVTDPWYRSLFRTPSITAAFGVLVLAFGGVLVYLLTQRPVANSSVAMKPTMNTNAVMPYAGIDTNSMSNSAATASNSVVPGAANGGSANTRRGENAPAANSTTTRAANSAIGAGSTGSGTASGGAMAPPQSTPVAAQPAPVVGSVADKPKDEEPKMTDSSRDEKETARNRALSDTRTRGDTSARKAVSEPLRSAAPVQNQMQMKSQSAEMPVTRHAGGKTFHNSGGAWYDAAYHGQSTMNIHRGTDDFKKLDAGLRSIANELGGVVVVVWKDRAYRIQ